MRHETNAVIIEYEDNEYFEIYFKPNEYGKIAEEMWEKLNEPVKEQQNDITTKSRLFNLCI